jgi:ABC-type transporter Mla subunit MlaD
VATKNSTADPARRGYYILAGLIAAAILIFNMDAIAELGRRDLTIVALLEEAPGVRAGTDVWVEGVRVGRVRNVAMVQENGAPLAALDLRIQARSRALVTTGSDVRAARRRFIGDPVVRISAGRPGDPPIQTGDTIRGQPRLTAEALLAEAANLPLVLDSLREAAALVQAQFERSHSRIDRLGRQLQLTMDAAGALSEQLDGGSLGPMLDGGTGLPSRARALRIRLTALAQGLTEVTERYGPDLEDGLAARIQGLAERSRSVQATLAALEAQIEEGDGFIGRFQQDTALQVAVRGVQLQIDSLVAEASSIALRMILP